MLEQPGRHAAHQRALAPEAVGTGSVHVVIDDGAEKDNSLLIAAAGGILPTSTYRRTRFNLIKACIQRTDGKDSRQSSPSLLSDNTAQELQKY